MTRSELYSKIKELNLQNEIVTRYGKNFTQVSSKELENLLNEIETSMKKSCDKSVNNNESLKKLIEVLEKKKILLLSEINYILN